MFSIDSLILHSASTDELELLLLKRQYLIDKAFSLQDQSTLREIADIDKKNMAVLSLAKSELAKKISQLGKVQSYCE